MFLISVLINSDLWSQVGPKENFVHFLDHNWAWTFWEGKNDDQKGR